ncbi:MULTISPECIES: hypothetical protein [Rhodopirellula]|uniref:hypothetical protein n=1 Tax=Rhodopirellula TaxID=265488 RepID=UPI00257E7E0B|nr:hypothetical protein [Rhodopirellula sp. UBA1907]
MNSIENWIALRKRNRNWSCFAMLLFPSLATLTYAVVRQFYWQPSDLYWFLLYFTYSLHGIFYGVFTTQLVIWWHWRPRTPGRWQTALLLLFVYLLGIYITSIFRATSGSIGFVPASLISLGYGLAGIATHWFAIVATGVFNTAHIVDLASRTGQSTESNCDRDDKNVGSVEASETQASAGSRRESFSIATLMLATLVSALIFVLLRWTREVYSASGFAGGYPDSDVGQIAGLLSSAFANSLCMLAAVNWFRRRVVWIPFVLILAGLSLSVAGRFVGMIFDGAQATSLDAGTLFAIVLDAAGMLLLHGWLLQRWSRAGYRFE